MGQVGAVGSGATEAAREIYRLCFGALPMSAVLERIEAALATASSDRLEVAERTLRMIGIIAERAMAQGYLHLDDWKAVRDLAGGVDNPTERVYRRILREARGRHHREHVGAIFMCCLHPVCVEARGLIDRIVCAMDDSGPDPQRQGRL